MQIRFGSHKKIQFTDKTHPLMGIVSVIIGGVSLVALIALFCFSGSVKGKAGLGIGILGILNLALSVVGFIMAIKCYKKEDVYMSTPTIGSILNGLLVIGEMLLYIIGAV